MAAFFIILGVPLLGALLYVAQEVSRTGGTPGARNLARSAVLLLGGMVGAAGVFTLIATVVWIFETTPDSLFLAAATFLSRVCVSVLMLWASRSALRVYRRPLPMDADDAFVTTETERSEAELRLTSLMLVLVPILLLAVFGVVIVVPIMLWGVAFWTTRRAREAQFLWTLSLAVRQELPLAEEIDAFAQPLWNRQKKPFYALASRIRDGRSLGESLEMSTGVLPMPLATEIRVAEESGTLLEVLSDLATKTTNSLSRSRLDSSLAVTLVYSWALLAVILVVISFVMYWIIPKYKRIFEDFGIELPEMTMSVIGASDFFANNFLILMPLVGLPLVVAGLVAAQYFVGWGNLNVPLVMRWFPRRDAPALLRALSHAVAADVSLQGIVSDMAMRHRRSDIRSRLNRLSRSLGAGQEIWEPLAIEGFVRPVEADALAAAERADNLPWAMQTLADSIDRSARHRMQFLLELIKPALVIGIGLVVGWFVIAMFKPLVHLITTLS